jgi:HK97 family phage major capsid protein
MLRALVLARGDVMQAETLLASRWPSEKLAAQVLRAATTAGSTLSGQWGAQLSALSTLSGEVIELARPASIVLRLSGARRVPFNTRVAKTSTGSTVGWVGQGSPKPVSELAFSEITIGLAKAAGIVVISQELARSSDPSAETTIRGDLIASLVAFIDAQFIDPANVAVTGVHPGSILSGVTPIASSGTGVANVITDLNAAIAALTAAGSVLANPLWVLHPIVASRLSLMRDSSGGPAFGAIGVSGGTLAGIAAITSTAVPRTASGGSIIVLLDQSEILLARDDAVGISVSAEASLSLDSAPSSSASAQVSLWQMDLVGILAEVYANWQPRRSPAAVASYIDGVMY